MKLKILITGVALMLFGCGDVDINNYEGKKPEITIKDFYSSPMHGYGIFQDRAGEVKDRYYVYLIPTWKGNEGKIIEKQWNDQGKLFFQQEWHVKLAEDGKTFAATATKIDGTVKGESCGYALHMIYTLKIPRDNGKEISIDADDWTYLQPDGTGINKVAMSKFGFKVGEVTYNLHKLGKDEKLHEGYTPQ